MNPNQGQQGRQRGCEKPQVDSKEFTPAGKNSIELSISLNISHLDLWVGLAKFLLNLSVSSIQWSPGR